MITRAKLRLIVIITGMLMIIGGVFFFISKIQLNSDFFSPNSEWPIWASILCMLPLLAGIVLMLIYREKWWPRIFSIASAIGLLVVISHKTTLVLQHRLPVYQWILIGGLLLGGLAIILVALFAGKKKKHE